MPTLSLYDTAAHPDAWHRVIAPGGYEWWHFVADDAAAALRVQIDFFDGDPFSGTYVLAYKHYRRWPTRVTPPTPRGYPAVRLTVEQRGTVLYRAEARLTAGAVQGSAGGPDIRFGPHSLTRDSDGVWHLRIDALAVGKTDRRVSAELNFRPHEPVQAVVRQLPTEQKFGTHFRVIGSTAYAVVATIRCGANATSLEGSGHHTHFFGCAPLEVEAHRWHDRWSAENAED